MDHTSVHFQSNSSKDVAANSEIAASPQVELPSSSHYDSTSKPNFRPPNTPLSLPVFSLSIQKEKQGVRFHLVYVHFSLVNQLKDKIISLGGKIDVFPTPETKYIITNSCESDQVIFSFYLEDRFQEKTNWTLSKMMFFREEIWI